MSAPSHVLITGVAGFIGFHVARTLLESGVQVTGIDNLNDYYDVRLKQARLARLQDMRGFRFHAADIADRNRLWNALSVKSEQSAISRPSEQQYDVIIHLAAQAGVRYSLTNPWVYVDSNITGTLNIFEYARTLAQPPHVIYASSSSVYGSNTKVPFSIRDDVSNPISLYAASKRSCELIAHTYAHLYRIPATGLRFFTVYGQWGRPDMACYIFADKISHNQPIRVFNHGNMRRDFTFIDDIIAGIMGAVNKGYAITDDKPPARIYNLGNSRPEDLMTLIELIEAGLGKKAERKLEPMQPGDVPATWADITESERDLGYKPKVTLQQGVPQFIDWYKWYTKTYA